MILLSGKNSFLLALIQPLLANKVNGNGPILLTIKKLLNVVLG